MRSIFTILLISTFASYVLESLTKVLGVDAHNGEKPTKIDPLDSRVLPSGSTVTSTLPLLLNTTMYYGTSSTYCTLW